MRTSNMIGIGGTQTPSKCGAPITDSIDRDLLSRGCLKGLCRRCRCILQSGTVLCLGGVISAPATILGCQSVPVTDIVISPLRPTVVHGILTRSSEVRYSFITNTLVRSETKHAELRVCNKRTNVLIYGTVVSEGCSTLELAIDDIQDILDRGESADAKLIWQANSIIKDSDHEKRSNY